jgi:amino acid adenylation domain-containing protein/FkbH-like protein
MPLENIEAIYPLSPIQEALLSQLRDAANLKLNSGQLSFVLRGRLDVAAFGRAWRLTVERHPVLRTSFAWKRVEKPLQIVNKKVDLCLALHDLLGLAGADRQNELEILRRAEFNRPFNPSELPQFRLTLCRTAEDAHLFIWTYARLILDGYSLPLILKDVFALYAAFVEGRQAQPQTGCSYGDYLEWLTEQDLSEAERFWRQELKGFCAPTPLGIDRPVDDPSDALEEYGSARIRVSSATSAALSALAAEHQLTLGALLQGAWALVLNRYSGYKDVVIGAMVSGRPASLPGAESIAGRLGNTLPVRFETPYRTSALEWLQRIEAHMLCLRGWQYTSAAQIRSLSGLPEGLPLFDSCVVVDDYPAYDLLPFGSETLQILDIENFEAANSSLTLKALPGDGLILEAKYDRRRFADDQVIRLLRHVEATLEGLIANPTEAVSQLPRMTDRESRQLLVEWNQTRTEYPRERCIHHLFADQAAQMPDKIAVLFEEHYLTYRELNRRANQLAHWLRLSGVGPEVLVGICAERSLEMIIGILGILKAGGAYVPLDPAYPLERLAFMLEDAQSPILLTQEKLSDALPAHWGQVIYLDTDWESHIAPLGDADPICRTAPENLAYVMYTSGSTGKPKGAAVTHRNVVRLVKETGYASFTSAEVFLQLAPISFDAATFEVWGSLLNGAELAVFPAHRPSLEDIGDAISRYRVTTLWLTAGLFHLMVEERLDDLRPLRQLLAGGDVLSIKHTEEVTKRLDGLNLINGYGPTESTTFACCYPVSGVGQPHSSLPIGKPISNTTVYVLTADLEPLPVGVTGELYIGGDGLARGYVNRVERTAEKFIPNPFGDEPGERLYKTGDLARYRTDGNIEFLGRKDHQVKVRGFRIELGEVEAVLRQHPSVQDVAVTARESAHGDRRLIAYVVVNKEAAISQDDLRSFLKRKLPEHMLPSSLMILDSLPLSPNGKVNRSALPAPADDASESTGLLVRSMTYIEELLSEVWADVLDVKRVSIKDNFFDLGGHSLLATQVISRVRNIFKIDMPLQGLFQSQDLEDFARSAEAAIKTGQPMSAPPLAPTPRDGELPLSFSQQRLWFLDQMEPGNSAFYIPCVVRLSGDLQVEALEKSLNEIIRRHEALRTTFISIQGQPSQVIAAEMPLRLPIIDLQHTAGGEEVEIERLIIAEAHRPFHLAQGALLRATLLQLDAQERLLLITMHHIISDGWSLGVFAQELASFYKSFLNNRPSPLDDLPIQYVDYARWQRDWLRGEVLEAQLEYWVKQLSGCPPLLELPADRPRPPVQTYRGAKQSLVLSPELKEALKSLSRREGVTLFTTLLAAFKLLLHRYSGQDDVIVGSPIAGRNHTEVEGLIGFFLNTLALRTDLSGNPTFRELLRREREVTLGAYAHQDLPFEKLLEVLQPERDLSRTPLFQVFFNMLNFPKVEMDLPGLTIELLWTPEIESKFDLTLYVEERQDGIHLDLVYRTDLFDRPRMIEMLEQLQFLLSQVARAPENQIGSFSLVTPSAAMRLPDPTQPIHADWQGPVHTLFHQQACRNAERLAVKDKRASWTYGELDSRSNRLAGYLLSKGLQPEDVVAIYAHRSAALVWAMLGILKAGAAFLILDPAHPAPRLIECLQIARPRAWLHIEGAREIPESVDEYLSTLPLACRLMLADHKTDEGLALLESDPTCEPGVELTPDSLAYVAFTSGSTGKPKAVMGRHGPLAFFTTWAKEVFGLDDSERITMLSGLSHDPLHRDIFTPLQLGATLCIPDQEDVIMSGGLSQWISQEKITVINLTPAMGKLVTESTPECPIETLRYAFFVGDALSKSDVSRLWKIAPSLTCVNLYGSTETQRALGYYIVPRAADMAREPAGSRGKEILSLGRGIQDVQLLVINDAGQLAGVGELGEIYFRSPHLARGYLDDEALTRERFVTNPFTKAKEDRLYKTGDLGRYLPDGEVEFVGRNDRQVKIRGFRIEPAEIEAVLSRHPAVREAAVVAREDHPGEKRLVAYVVGNPHPALRAGDLRSFLKEELPEYMVPSTFVVMDALPLTPQLKIDRRALPPPERTRAEPEVGFAAARTPTEEVLAAIWADVLGITEVSIHDDFFELGGHSLLATQVFSRLRDSFKVDVPLRALFASPTVAGLAQSVEAAMRAGVYPEAPPIVPVGRDEKLSLSYAQQHLWFLDQLEPRNPAYHMPAAVRLAGPLNVDALSRTFNELARRHESLRTSFPVANGYPVQLIAPMLHGDLRLEDLSALPEDEREAEVERQANDEARRPFDLARGPLLRIRLLRIAEKTHVLLLTMHHIISDGWSMGVLVREAAALYGAFCDERPSPLEELRIQYADFARWQQEWLKGDVLEAHLSYWKGELAGAPDSLALPTDRPRPATRSYRSARHSIVLPPSLVHSINSVSRRQSVSPFMTMLTALKILLFRWTGQSDIIVGTVSANRNYPELENLIGCFIDFLPLRARLSSGQTALDLLGQVKATVLESFAHQDCPFAKIIEAVKPNREAGRTPIYNVAFLMQNFAREAHFSETLRANMLPTARGLGGLLDLRFVAVPDASPAGWPFACEYKTELFDADTIAHLMDSYCAILTSMLRHLDVPVSSFDLSDELESRARAARQRDAKSTMVITATFTAEPIEESLAFWMEELGIQCEIKFAPYNQVFQQLLDPSSLLSKNQAGVNVILLRLEDWQRHEVEVSEGCRGDQQAENNVRDMVTALRTAAERSAIPHLLCLCPASSMAMADQERAALLKQMEEVITCGLREAHGVYLITASEILSTYPVEAYDDRYGDEQSHIPYTSACYAAIGTMIARKINALNHPPYKVIVLDCDQTLWEGVCGEDGACGVRIDPPRIELQKFMVAQHDAGMLICLCSKNNEEDVIEVFERREDMCLKREHILSWRHNWKPKSENIRSLADELKLGLESFIFIDDNPLECAEVEANCPAVLTLQLPQDVSRIPIFLQHIWAFDHLKSTEEDRRRTACYRQNQKRELARSNSLTFDEFLTGLGLEVRISELSPPHMTRVSELTRRTNQFNLTTVRRSESEIERLCLSSKFECLCVEARDRFGDYGLVGVMIFEAGSEALEVDTFLLSCRALGRGVEHRMLARLGETAKERGLSRINLRYMPTDKNRLAFEVLESIGAPFKEPSGAGSVFRLPADLAAALSPD